MQGTIYSLGLVLIIILLKDHRWNSMKWPWIEI